MPTNVFILNIHLLYNHQWIMSAIPIQTQNQLKVSPMLDHVLMQSHTAKTLQSKKGANGEDTTPNTANETEPSTFDQQSKACQKDKTKQKAKVTAVPVQTMLLDSQQALCDIQTHSSLSHNPGNLNCPIEMPQSSYADDHDQPAFIGPGTSSYHTGNQYVFYPSNSSSHSI